MISDVYFPRINGVSTSIRNFRRELLDLGNEVSLTAPAYGQHEDEPFVFRVPSRYVPVDCIFDDPVAVVRAMRECLRIQTRHFPPIVITA